MSPGWSQSRFRRKWRLGGVSHDIVSDLSKNGTKDRFWLECSSRFPVDLCENIICRQWISLSNHLVYINIVILFQFYNHGQKSGDRFPSDCPTPPPIPLTTLNACIHNIHVPVCLSVCLSIYLHVEFENSIGSGRGYCRAFVKKIALLYNGILKFQIIAKNKLLGICSRNFAVIVKLECQYKLPQKKHRLLVLIR